jgi:hypothetical protein
MRRYPEALVAPSRRRATARSLLPAWLSRWVRPLAKRARATRIPKQAVIAVAKDVRVDVDATRTPAWSVERWLVERVLVRLPGGR